MINKENLETVVLEASELLTYEVEIKKDEIVKNAFNIFRFGRLRASVGFDRENLDIIQRSKRIARNPNSIDELAEILFKATTYRVDEKGFLDMDYRTYQSLDEEEKEFMRKSFKWNPDARAWEVKEGGEYIVELSERFQLRLERNREKILGRIQIEVHPVLLDKVLELV